MDLEKMINWDLVDNSFKYAVVNEVAISFYVTKPLAGEPIKIIERPRVFEDGALYPVLTKNNIKTVARYFENTNSFLPESGHYNCDGDEFSFIGEKLPGSLWGE